MPENTAKPPIWDAADYRCALSQFPTGVCLVSAADCELHERPFAITVNSFASVSLQPPLVSWCIQHGSSSYALWNQTTQFAISVLNQDQSDLCDYFARRGQHPIANAEAFERSPNGQPWVRGACANFDATVVARHTAGDHDVIIAEVTAFTSDATRSPLLYHQGRVHAPT